MLAAFIVALPSASPARAQEGDGREATPAPRVVLRPERQLLPLTTHAARLLRVRLDVPVEIGEAPPGDLAEGVRVGEIGLVHDGEVLRLVLPAAGDVFFTSELALSPRNRSSAARALALAIESLRDASVEPLPEEAEESRPAPTAADGATRRPSRIVRVLPGGRPWPSNFLPVATPILYLRLIAGVSPIRGTFLFGPGMGLGLCVSSQCAVLEGDLALIPEERQVEEARARYQAINFSARVQLRPFELGAWIPGISFGLLTRVGTATLIGSTGVEQSRVVTNLGARGTIEIALRFLKRFEAVLEGGIDFAIDRARFLRRSGTPVLLEDRWTPWFVFSMRLRP